MPVNIDTQNRMKKTIEFNANNSFQITHKFEEKNERFSSVFGAFLHFSIHFDQPAKQLYNSFSNKSQ